MVSTNLIKELRERTGAGIMDCKNALTESNGDIEKAVEIMRKSGQVKAAKKSGRIAADGMVVIHQDGDKAVILEINSETDFVAKGDAFIDFGQLVAKTILKEQTTNMSEVSALVPEGQAESIEKLREALITKVGENIQLRRAEIIRSEGVIGSYRHGVRIGVLVTLKGGDEALAKDVAMHIAASKPLVVNPEDIDQALLDKEREIYLSNAESSGKPADVIEKMVEGRLKKFLAEESLTGQPYVKEPKQTVGQLLKAAQAEVITFTRYEVGEGIEKKEVNFAEEVKAQMASN